MRVVTFKLIGGGSYTVPLETIGDPLNGDLADLQTGESCSFICSMGEMTQEEYEALPEFEGH